MKRLLNSSLLIMLLGITVSAQEVNDASIVGILTEGKTVSAAYSAIDTVNPTFEYLWMRIDMDALPDPDTVDLVTTEDYTIVSADIGYRLLLRVDLWDPSVRDTAWSAISPVIIANSKPVASNVTMTGGLEVGNYIFGNYDYNDVDEDLEGTSVYRWVISVAGDFSDTVVIAGATSQSYQIQSSDQNKNFFFGVKPVTPDGSRDGDYVWSSVHGPVIANTAPVASNAAISGGLNVDAIISATYSYYDADNDLEGTSVYRWVISVAGDFSDTVEIAGATSQSYQIQSSDQNMNFFFGVKPVAQTGVLQGEYHWSSVHGPVTANIAPVASDAAISGGLNVDDIISATYSYYDADNDLEGTSVYRWVISVAGDFSDTVVIAG
ncbi:MAG: hypothetical protein K8R35_09525, partial [Bacteroidales bacterium]|nr:hypothetical protein [Bacteroidales bacterium]